MDEKAPLVGLLVPVAYQM